MSGLIVRCFADIEPKPAPNCARCGDAMIYGGSTRGWLCRAGHIEPRTDDEKRTGWAVAASDLRYHHFSGTRSADCRKVVSEYPRCDKVPTGELSCRACVKSAESA